MTFRAVTSGASDETIDSVVYAGNSLIEPPPANLRAFRIAGSQIYISWLTTGYFGGKNTFRTSKYFTGFQVSVNGVITTTTNPYTTVSDPGGTVTVIVKQINSFTGPGKAAQITV